jgi:hypothetical protein
VREPFCHQESQNAGFLSDAEKLSNCPPCYEEYKWGHIPGAKERLEACGDGRKRLIARTGETTEVAANRFARGLQSLT